VKTLLILTAFVASTIHAEELQVTVYNKTGLSGAILDSTIHLVRAVFRQAGVHLVFRPGDLSSQEAHEIVYVGAALTPADHRRLVCAARREIALDFFSTTLLIDGRAALGVAYPLAGTGLNVRIFANSVSAIAIENARTLNAVLANVIAHEIGHVLMRSTAHDRYGIMAADWSRNEFEQMARSRVLFFGKQHVRQMRSTLSGEGCAASLSAAILNPR
jgi:hypothetical protein